LDREAQKEVTWRTLQRAAVGLSRQSSSEIATFANHGELKFAAAR
jgi:hypothetical protein